MANTELLRQTLRRVQTNPSTWRQDVFRAGDTGCFAYHAAMLSGAELADPASHITTIAGLTAHNYDDHVAFNDAARSLGFDPDDFINIEEFARRALDLEPEDANELFSGNNTLADLRTILQGFIPGDE